MTLPTNASPPLHVIGKMGRSVRCDLRHRPENARHERLSRRQKGDPKARPRRLAPSPIAVLEGDDAATLDGATPRAPQ